MNARIYIVNGVEGCDSDRTEWPVAAYFSKAKAQAKVERCTVQANLLTQAFVEYRASYKLPHDPTIERVRPDPKPFQMEDPKLSDDDTTYFITETDLWAD